MRIFFKIIRYTFLFCVALSLSIYIFVRFYEDEIKQDIVDELNLRLNHKIEHVEIGIDFLYSFPSIKIQLKNLVLVENFAGKRQKSFEVGYLNFKFSIYDLFRENYRVSALEFKNAVVHLRADKNGKIQRIFKRSKKKRKFSLHLRNVLISNVELYYTNEYNHDDLFLTLDNASLLGTFDRKLYRMKLKASGIVHRFYKKSYNFAKESPFELNSLINIFPNAQFYEFKNTHINIGSNHYYLNGNIKKIKDHQQYLKFTITGMRNRLVSLVKLIPKSVKSVFNQYKVDGDVDFSMQVDGVSGLGKKPKITVFFNVKNGTISKDSLKQKLTNLKLNGEYSNGKNRTRKTTYLKVQNLSANYRNTHLSADFFLKNFDNPRISMQFNSEASITDLLDFYQNDVINTFDGNVNINASMDAAISEFSSVKLLQNSTLKGDFYLNNANFSGFGKNLQLGEIKSSVRFLKNHLIVDSLLANLNSDMPFQLKGFIDNLYNVLAGKSDSTKLVWNISLDTLDLKKLITLDFVKSGINKSKDSLKTATKLSPNWYFDLALGVDTLIYHDVLFTKVRAGLLYGNRLFQIKNLKFNFLGGKVKYNGNLNTDDKSFQGTLDAKYQYLDVEKLIKKIRSVLNHVNRDLLNRETKSSSVYTFLDALPENLKLNFKVKAKSAFYGTDSIKDLQTLFVIEKKGVKIKNFNCEYLEGDINVRANVFRTNDENVRVHARIIADYDDISLENFFNRLNNLKKYGIGATDSTNKSGGGSLALPEYLWLDFVLQSKLLYYKKVKLNDFYSNFNIRRSLANIRQIKFNAFDGSISLNGQLTEKNDSTYKTQLSLAISKLSLQKFLFAFDGFDRDGLNPKNLSATLEAKIRLASALDFDFKPIFESSQIGLDYELRDFQLKEHPVVRKLLGFLKSEKTDTVFFETVHGEVFVNDGRLYFPPTQMNNNITNLKVWGVVDPGKQSNFILKVSLLKFLFANNSRRKNQIKAHKLKNSSDLNVYLKYYTRNDTSKVWYEKKSHAIAFSSRLGKASAIVRQQIIAQDKVFQPSWYHKRINRKGNSLLKSSAD